MAPKRVFTAEEAQAVADQLGINFETIGYNLEQFRMGMDVELEHGTVNKKTNVTNDDGLLTGKIALAHLNELKDYYTRLDRMEGEAEAAR